MVVYSLSAVAVEKLIFDHTPFAQLKSPLHVLFLDWCLHLTRQEVKVQQSSIIYLQIYILPHIYFASCWYLIITFYASKKTI